MYHKIITDNRFMAVLDNIIFSFPGGKNAPIGNYISQWSGNFYLTPLDNFVKRELKIKDYLRFCDDFLLFGNDKKYLHDCRKRIGQFLKENLLLEYSKADVFDVKQGVDFCGYRHFNNFVLLRKSTKIREQKKIAEIKKSIESGNFDTDSMRSSIDSILGWLKHAKTYKLKQKYMLYELREKVA